MELSELTAISPIDGRYRKKVKSLASYFSEYGLFKYRLQVEVEYFISLCELPLPQLTDIEKKSFAELWNLVTGFSTTEALKIKELEKTTNHDIKALEYYLKQKLDKMGLAHLGEFIHFGLTSQDINNTSIPLLLKDSFVNVMLPKLQEITLKLRSLAKEWEEIPMLARTHGQPASPTILGKEIMVFVERLESQIAYFEHIPFSAKFGGATGNFNAHHVAYPQIDWTAFGNRFVNDKLGLKRSKYTTQIEHYDNLGAFCDCFKRINTILIDLSRDMWQYISVEYFKQKIKEGEIGSSAMPHKVNPIDFENSEGNLGIANAIFEHLSAKLPISRLQRDLTDSTVLRNIGVPMGHTIISFEATLKGLNKLLLNESKFHEDLEKNWAVVAEAIQTILRREGYPNPYEALKGLTRTNTTIDKNAIHGFIATLEVSDAIKAELMQITPSNFLGI